MKTFVKNYIGKGKSVSDFNIVKVTLKVADFEKFIFEKEGVKYLTFEIAEMKAPDQFGRTHTAYVSTLEQKEAEIEKTPEEIFESGVKNGFITKKNKIYMYGGDALGGSKKQAIEFIEKNSRIRRYMVTNFYNPALPF